MLMSRFSSGKMTKAAGVAALAAPYVRRVASDEELRDDMRELMRSANKLYTRVGRDNGLRGIVYDDRVRRDVENVLDAIQHGAQRVIPPPAPRHHWLRWFFIISAVIGGAAALLFYPRGREKVMEPVKKMFRGDSPSANSWDQPSGSVAA